ncbi:MAG: porin, partial [Roseinatronobacter sp.]|nr:porin [Roseinatronobacter sp.]
GVAAADVTLSGDARMGIIHDNTKTANKTSFTSRARVTFTLTGETDSGLAFGGSFRADNAGGAAAGTAGSVFISGDFGRLTLGDTNGAAEARNGDLHGVGLTGLGDLNEFTYLSNAAAGRPTARYDYTIDGFSFSISHTNPGVASKVMSAGIGYAMDGFTVGLGAERQNATAGVAAVPAVAGVATCGAGNINLVASAIAGGLVCTSGSPTVVASVPGVAAVAPIGTLTHYVVSAGYSMDGISVKAMYGRLKEAGATQPLAAAGFAAKDQYGLSASGTFDAITVSAFGRRDFAKDTHIGVGAAYNLGGGATLRGGVVNTNFNAANKKSRTVGDLGLAFTF